MEIQFNQTIDITISRTDEVFCRITRGVTDGIEVGDTWLSMPLDVAMILHAKLGHAIEEGKEQMNAKIKEALK
jgi:hypothetical protein